MQVSLLVTRGGPSMWLFAFVFGSSFNLCTGILNDLTGAWERLKSEKRMLAVGRLLLFFGLFLLVMKSALAHNWLSNHLGWLTSSPNRELQGFVAFVFASFVALSNSLLNDLRNKPWLRIALRIAAFTVLFIVFFKVQAVGHWIEGLLTWLRIEHY